jgi:hypothetical protein
MTFRAVLGRYSNTGRSDSGKGEYLLQLDSRETKVTQGVNKVTLGGLRGASDTTSLPDARTVRRGFS